MSGSKDIELKCLNKSDSKASKKSIKAQNWDNECEFLLSCISLSVGLGNVWRFPYIAYQNGGGAFLIPYAIVLLIIGKPIYYLEVLLGQFTGRGIIKSFNFSPLLKGIAAGQVVATAISLTYYSSVMAITLHYFVASFNKILPWSYYRNEWKTHIINTSAIEDSKIRSPAELYFEIEVLNEKQNISDGIGMPNWQMVRYLGIAWLIIGSILIRGIRSTGKAAYFLGIFPYVILIVLLIRAVTLPGALDGLIYFFKPQWKELCNPLVWYSAVTQVFFSLAICFGTVVTYASYNAFDTKVYNDIFIITTMDSLSSVISGCITFGILGNLAMKSGVGSIKDVVKGGVGLAFISYPEAISKFDYAPQFFSALFFLMLFILGIGSTIGMASSIIRVIRDHFTEVKTYTATIYLTISGFGLSVIYTTPGGQFILNLVDFYGVSFTSLLLAIGELLALCWAYGVHRFCQDITFMTGSKPGIYWKLCWKVLAPGIMMIVFLYTLIHMEPLKYKNVSYPLIAHVIGSSLTVLGLIQVPIWAIYSILKQKNHSVLAKIKMSFKPNGEWGPTDEAIQREYLEYHLSSSSSNH